MIHVDKVGPGVRIVVPCFAKHHAGHGDTITLTRDEAIDLLAKLQAIVESGALQSSGATGGPK